MSYRCVYSNAGIYKAIRHQFSASAQAPMLFSRISMVQVHEGLKVEVIAEVMDHQDMPPGDELSGADAYDDLEDLPFENRAIACGRHSLAGASGASDLPSDPSGEGTREFYANVPLPSYEDRPFVQSLMSADLTSSAAGLAREGEDIMSFTDTISGPLSTTRSGTRSKSIGSADLNNFQDDDEDLSMSVPSQQSRSQMSLPIIISSFFSGDKRSKGTNASMSLGGLSEL